MGPIGGACFFDCTKQSGKFCDLNTRNCESCYDICLPLRGTPEECRQKISCKDFWDMTASALSEKLSPGGVTSETTVSAPNFTESTIIIAIAIVILFCVIVIFLVICFKKGLHKRLLKHDRCWGKRPIQVSPEEREREQFQSFIELRNIGSVVQL